MKRKRRLTPIKETPKRKRKRSRIKETPVQTGKPKRQRIKPVKDKRIESVFYLCTKTLKDGNGKACFVKGNKYLLQRHLETGTADLRGMILRSEVWGHHVVRYNNWGQYFTKMDETEMLLPEQREWVDPRIRKWQEDSFEFITKLKDNEEALEIQARVINHLLYGGDRESVTLWQNLIAKIGRENRAKQKRKRSIKSVPKKKKRRRAK